MRVGHLLYSCRCCIIAESSRSNVSKWWRSSRIMWVSAKPTTNAVYDYCNIWKFRIKRGWRSTLTFHFKIAQIFDVGNQVPGDNSLRYNQDDIFIFEIYKCDLLCGWRAGRVRHICAENEVNCTLFDKLMKCRTIVIWTKWNILSLGSAGNWA